MGFGYQYGGATKMMLDKIYFDMNSMLADFGRALMELFGMQKSR